MREYGAEVISYSCLFVPDSSPKDDAGMLLEKDVSDFYRIASGLKTPKADDNEVLFV